MRRTVDVQPGTDEVAAENRMLRQAAAVDERLVGAMVGGGLDGLAEGVAALTGLSCAIHRAGTRRRVAGARGAGSDALPVLCERATFDPEVAAALAGLASGRATVLGPFQGPRTARRFVVAPIDSGGPLVGHLVIAEHGRRLDAMDGVIAVRAARLAALELGSDQRRAALAEAASSALARELLGIRPPEGALEKWAVASGVDFERSSHVVCHVASRDPGSSPAVGADEIVRALRDRGHARVLGVDVEDGVALILRVPGGGVPHAATRALKGPVSEALGVADPGRGLVAAISYVCRSVADLPDALGQCRRMAEHRASVGLEDDCVLADDIGRGRLFLSSVPPREMQRFAEGVLGPILEPSGRWSHLLATLVAYVDEGRSMRGTAARLSMHENTVRYRLKKVRELTGLDVVGSHDDQLTAQITVSFLNRLPA